MNKQQYSHDGLKRVLIINSDGNAFNNPSLKCIIDLLLENGCNIDLRYPKSRAPTPSYPGVRFLPYGNLLKAIKLIAFDWFCSWALINLSVYIENITLYKNYDLLVGVDRRGLIEASVLNKITGIPYIFLSFEIMFASETSARYKLLEKQAAKKVTAWIVQDEIRAEQAQIENNLDPANKMLLPLASAGIGEMRHDRLRDNLGIPVDKKVAIMIGTLSNWTMIDQVLHSVPNWPEEWVLIIHGRYGDTFKYINNHFVSLTPFFGKRIFISDAAAKVVDEMGSILAGVNVGLAFYMPDYSFRFTGKNLEFLGFASGKISTYFRYGVPVMVNKIGLYADEIVSHKLGIVIDHPGQISDQLNNFDFLEFSDNARTYFLNSLDFNLCRDFIWQKLSSIMINKVNYS